MINSLISDPITTPIDIELNTDNDLPSNNDTIIAILKTTVPTPPRKNFLLALKKQVVTPATAVKGTAIKVKQYALYDSNIFGVSRLGDKRVNTFS